MVVKVAPVLETHEQKNEAPSHLSANTLSANVYATVLSCVLANPFNQYMGDLWKSLAQCLISPRTALHVPLR